jgi:predicted DNA-binding protein (MmcQ/YjbR family)
MPEADEGIFARVRAICDELPEALVSSDRWAHKFTVSRRVFAYVFAMDNPRGDQVTMLVCRADPEERAALVQGGHPYFAPNSGTDRIGIVLDDETDWTEVAELVAESYRLNAPKRLRA